MAQIDAIRQVYLSTLTAGSNAADSTLRTSRSRSFRLFAL